MRHRRKRWGKKRGKSGPAFSMLAVIVVIVLLALSTGLFFNVTEIIVEGAEIVAPDLIKEASGLTQGENLMFINKNSAAREIINEFAYIDEVRIMRRLPGTVLIQVKEAEAVCVIEHMDDFWKLSKTGKLLESVSFISDTELPIVIGASLAAPYPGSRMAFSGDDKEKEQILIDILGAMDAAGILEDVDKIDISKSFEIHFAYLGRLDVTLGMPVDIPYKLAFFKSVVSQLEPSSRGKLDLSSAQDATAHFVPDE